MLIRGEVVISALSLLRVMPFASELSLNTDTGALRSAQRVFIAAGSAALRRRAAESAHSLVPAAMRGSADPGACGTSR